MYTYVAFVDRVVDGDTFYATVDLGFRVYTKLAFRLLGVDTPEIFRPSSAEEKSHGMQAKKFVESLILDRQVMIKTKKTGKYGRWLAVVYPIVEGIDQVKDLSTTLIEAGYAKRDNYI